MVPSPLTSEEVRKLVGKDARLVERLLDFIEATDAVEATDASRRSRLHPFDGRLASLVLTRSARVARMLKGIYRGCLFC